MSSWTRPASRRPTTLIGKRLKASHLYPFPVVAGFEHNASGQGRDYIGSIQPGPHLGEATPKCVRISSRRR